MRTKRWKPKTGEEYFMVLMYYSFNPEVSSSIWQNHPIDKAKYRLGNCFQTYKDAKVKLEEIKKLLQP